MEMPLAIIIEDDRDLAMIHAEAVKGAGYSVEIYYSGSQGLGRVKEIIPHLIVLDLHLPEISGLEIYRHIRNDPRLTGINMIITSADDRLAMTIDNATLVLLKPVSLVQLRDLSKRLKTGWGV
jgi:CheY-like chemotaxis protein